MLATVAAADRTSTVRKKYSVFIYSEAEPHADNHVWFIMIQTVTIALTPPMRIFKPSSQKIFCQYDSLIIL